MKIFSITALAATTIGSMAPLPTLANPSVWNTETVPSQPYQYVESAPVSQRAPFIENAETYASDSLFQRLYPSINQTALTEESTIDASIVSKTRENMLFPPRGILSSYYLQEYAYIDTYTNIREHEQSFSFPNIRMSLAMPLFGNGDGRGYQPLQFGFGPAAFRFW